MTVCSFLLQQNSRSPSLHTAAFSSSSVAASSLSPSVRPSPLFPSFVQNCAMAKVRESTTLHSNLKRAFFYFVKVENFSMGKASLQFARDGESLRLARGAPPAMCGEKAGGDTATGSEVERGGKRIQSQKPTGGKTRWTRCGSRHSSPLMAHGRTLSQINAPPPPPSLTPPPKKKKIVAGRPVFTVGGRKGIWLSSCFGACAGA